MFRKIIVVALLLVTTNATSIEIVNLAKNQELLILVTGECYVQTSNFKIIHIIDLEIFVALIKKVDLILEDLTKFSFPETIEILKSKLQTVQTLYGNLLPRKREKRGIFNFLGTGIKEITGNMDHSDYIEISHELSKLNFQNDQLLTENNKQVQINSTFDNAIKQI